MIKMFWSGFWAACSAANFGIAAYDYSHHHAVYVLLGLGVFDAWASLAYLAAWLKNSD